MRGETLAPVRQAGHVVALGGQDGERRAGGRAVEIRGRAAVQRDVGVGRLEGRLGEVVPGAAAAAGDVHGAVELALGDVDQRGGQVPGVGGAADLVVDDGDLVAFGGEAAH